MRFGAFFICTPKLLKIQTALKVVAGLSSTRLA
jgi:hypothetical protein